MAVKATSDVARPSVWIGQWVCAKRRHACRAQCVSEATRRSGPGSWAASPIRDVQEQNECQRTSFCFTSQVIGTPATLDTSWLFLAVKLYTDDEVPRQWTVRSCGRPNLYARMKAFLETSGWKTAEGSNDLKMEHIGAA
ncbi:hypothetical protein VTI74DRAFT_3568 [Chaetomium olivicolor]